jgi:phospholipid/cholesterol/gamma-HCH transport system substrate-binding protein
MNSRTQRFAVGFFVLAMLGLLVVLAVFFSRGVPIFLGNYTHYLIQFDDVSGVSPGTPVRRAGVRIGEVRSLDLDDVTGKVKVSTVIDRQHVPRQGDRAVLVRALLGGDAFIDLVPPEVEGLAREPLPPDSELTGQRGTDVQKVLSQTSTLVPSTQETLDEIRKSLQRFEKMAPLLEDTTKEYRDLAKEARAAIPDLRRTNDEAQVAIQNWGTVGERANVLLRTNEEKLVKALDQFNETVGRVSNLLSDENQRYFNVTLKNVRTASDNLDSISKNTDAFLRESRQTLERLTNAANRADDVLVNLQQATKPVAERSASVMRNMDESSIKLNRLLSDIDELLRTMFQGEGSLRRLATDPALYNNLTDAACMLVRIMPRVDRMLHDMEVFADKIARHPESLGLGGVVRPSAGLKEAPRTSNSWPQ